MSETLEAKQVIDYTDIIYEDSISPKDKEQVDNIFNLMKCHFSGYVHTSLENIPASANKITLMTILLVKSVRHRLSQFLPILIRYGGNPDSSVQLTDTDACTTALYEAVRINNIKTVTLLCNSGSHCTEPVGNREKLVFLSAMNGNAKIVKILIKSGADYTGVSTENKSIHDYEHDDHDKYLLANCNVTALIQRREFFSDRLRISSKSRRVAILQKN